MRKLVLGISLLALWACTKQEFRSSSLQEAEAQALMDSHPDSAVSWLETQIRLNPKKQAAWTYKMLGTYYMQSGDNERAASYYFEALAKYQEAKDTAGMAAIYLNLTNVEDRSEQSWEWHQKSIGLYRSIGNYQGVAKNYVNLGTSYMDSNKLQRAADFYQKARDLSQAHKIEKTLVSSSLNLAILRHKMGEKAIAIELIHPVLKYYQETDNHIGLVYSYFNLGQFYWPEQTDSVQYYSGKALEEAGSDYPQLQAMVYQTLRELAIREQRFALAQSYHHRFDSIADLQVQINGANLVTKVEAEFDLAQSRQKADFLIEDLKRQKRINLWIGILAIGVLLYLGFFLWSLRRKSRETKILMEQDRALIKARNELNRARLLKLETEEKVMRQKLNQQRSELSQMAARIVKHKSLIQKMEGLASNWKGKKASPKFRDFARSLRQIMREQDAAPLLIKEAFIVYQRYLKVFSERYTQLTDSDLEYIILFDLNLSTKEVAAFLEVQDQTVNMRRYKLRKKLNLTKGQELEAWLREVRSSI